MHSADIQDDSKLEVQTLREIGHIMKIQNCPGIHVPNCHLNPLWTMCFMLFFKRCGRGFWILNF